MPQTNSPIRVLHLEDSPLDAKLIQSKLETGGLVCNILRVDNRASFESALDTGVFDLVLCDYNLPGYDGVSAMKRVREKQLSVPVILISGTLGEEEAVRALRMGAADYLLKQRLERLPSAVTRALNEAREQLQSREAEQRLTQERTLGEMILNSMPSLFYLITEEGRFLRWNRRFETVSGYSGGEIGRMHPLDFFASEHKALVAARILEVFQTGENEGEADFLTKQGARLRFYFTAAVVMVDGKQCLAGTGMDITKGKLAETALKEREAQLREAQRIGRMGSWRLDLVANRLEWSDEIFRIFETDAQRFGASYEAFLQAVHPDDRESVNRAYTESLRNHTPYEIVHRLHSPDGRVKFVHERCETVYDSTGRPLRSLGTVQDITELKLSESKARRQQKRFQDLFEFAPDAIVMTNAAGIITLVNGQAEQLFGYEHGELAGQPVEILIPESIRHGHVALRDQYLVAAVPRTMGAGRSDLKGLKKDGTAFPVEISLSPMDSDEGTQVVAVVRDMTERHLTAEIREKLEDQLRQTQKMEAIGQLAGGMAHDFNNQLTPITGYAEMLMERLDDPKLRQYAEHISNAARRAADLTRNMLAFARKGQFQNTGVNIHRLIQETCGMLGRTIDKRIVVKQQLEARFDRVSGDPSQLQNAFLNLAVNARDAMPAKGELVFSTENVDLDTEFAAKHGGDMQAGRYLKISVSDTGTGMTDDVKKHLFEPFFTTKAVGQGTGLGLASVYGTIKNHKGTLAVYSEVGHGTTFKIYLPLSEQTKAGPGRVSNRLTSTKLRVVKNIRVLVVEDEAPLRLMLSDILGSCGMECLMAENGRLAIEFYAQNWKRIDLVFLDMIMPEINGPDAFRAMKRINPNIKALLSTGFSLNNEVQTILDEGVLGFIQKPFIKKELIDRIIDALK